MLHFIVRCSALLLFGIAAAHAQYDDLIPPSKLRPIDPSQFHPELVRLHNEDLAEIRSILSNDLKRPDFAAGAVTKRLLGKLPMDGQYFAHFLNASSEAVQEWTLRTMGGYAGDKNAALPNLLKIVRDAGESDMHRALAARVIGTTRMTSETVSALVQQLGGASKELRVILLEVIASSSRAGITFVPQLKHYLRDPNGSVQFHGFRAIQQIEQTSSRDGDDPDLGVHYENARHLSQPEADTGLALRVLQQSDAPKYLTCVALLDLASSAETLPTDVILRRVGDADEFVAALAQNVLQRVGVGSRGVSTLAQGLSSSNAAIRINSLLQLRALGTEAKGAGNALGAALRQAATDAASPREVGTSLDVLRVIGTNAGGVSETLVQLLDEQSPIYRNVERHQVHRLRGFLFATLAETGVPKTALPVIVAALANSDRRAAMEFAGAARAAAALGPAAREAVPFLLRALTERIDEDFIAFDTFDSHGVAGSEHTTCQVEALRALSRIGASDESTVQVVRAFLEQPRPELDGTNLFRRIPNLRTEATKTLATIEVSRANKN
jgi:hypothetical protein